MSTHILRLCLVVRSDDNCLISDFKIHLAFIYLYTLKYIMGTMLQKLSKCEVDI